MEKQKFGSGDDYYEKHLDRVAAAPYPEDEMHYMVDFSDTPSPS